MNNFDELVKVIREKFSDAEVDIDEVTKMLESYPSKIEEWKKYRIFDNHKYTRNLVDTGNGKYNLMILCWGTGMASGIHNHQNSHCFVKVLEGTLTETKYYWPKSNNEQMEIKECTDFHKDSVSYMSDEIGLHRMENKSHSDGAVSLHLYIPPYFECDVFDERTGAKSTSSMTFYSKDGKIVEEL